MSTSLSTNSSMAGSAGAGPGSEKSPTRCRRLMERSPGSTFRRQRGQLEWISNHLPTQSRWKACGHLGSNRSTSESSKWERQTAQSSPCFDPVREENRKSGSYSTALSKPENLAGGPAGLSRRPPEVAGSDEAATRHSLA